MVFATSWNLSKSIKPYFGVLKAGGHWSVSCNHRLCLTACTSRLMTQASWLIKSATSDSYEENKHVSPDALLRETKFFVLLWHNSYYTLIKHVQYYYGYVCGWCLGPLEICSHRTQSSTADFRRIKITFYISTNLWLYHNCISLKEF